MEVILGRLPKTQLIKDQTLLEWKQDARSAVVDHFDTGRNIYFGLYYTRNLSLDAPKYIAKSNGADIAAIRKIPQYADDVALPFLPEFLRNNKARYKVLPTPEKVDGTDCWVVEWPGMDRFWVDPKRGFAIPRRIYCWDPGKPRRFEFHQSNYREVKQDLWLPFNLSEDVYASIIAEKEALWGKVTARSEYHLHSLEFDHVQDNLFDVKLPPGTRVIDMARKFQYTTPREIDTDPFNPAIAEAKLHRRANRNLILLLISFTVLLIVVLVYVVRYWRSRRSPSS